MRGVYLTAALLCSYLSLVGVNAYELTEPHHHTLHAICVTVWSLASLLGAFNLKCAWDIQHDDMAYAALARLAFPDKEDKRCP